ncbi:mucin-3A-like [Paramacrobiotus metropolitanus]|uniref:mucin-3A-like n=1 Tax=Paramacrobiotus metropolitanus TaxID=2943436 RepID=UPI00244583A2|nr:mucin-3A-like [Paramacrobiotus metropolitanus]
MWSLRSAQAQSVLSVVKKLPEKHIPAATKTPPPSPPEAPSEHAPATPAGSLDLEEPEVHEKLELSATQLRRFSEVAETQQRAELEGVKRGSIRDAVKFFEEEARKSRETVSPPLELHRRPSLRRTPSDASSTSSARDKTSPTELERKRSFRRQPSDASTSSKERVTPASPPAPARQISVSGIDSEEEMKEVTSITEDLPSLDTETSILEQQQREKGITTGSISPVLMAEHREPSFETETFVRSMETKTPETPHSSPAESTDSRAGSPESPKEGHVRDVIQRMESLIASTTAQKEKRAAAKSRKVKTVKTVVEVTAPAAAVLTTVGHLHGTVSASSSEEPIVHVKRETPEGPEDVAKTMKIITVTETSESDSGHIESDISRDFDEVAAAVREERAERDLQHRLLSSSFSSETVTLTSSPQESEQESSHRDTLPHTPSTEQLHSPTRATSFMTQPVRELPVVEGHDEPKRHVELVTAEEEEALPVTRRVNVEDVPVSVITTETVVREETLITKRPLDTEKARLSPTEEHAHETETRVREELPESEVTGVPVHEHPAYRAESPEVVPQTTETYVHEADDRSDLHAVEREFPHVHRIEETVIESHNATETVIETHRVETTVWSESSTSETIAEAQSSHETTRETSFASQPIREPPEMEDLPGSKHARKTESPSSPVERISSPTTATYVIEDQRRPGEIVRTESPVSEAISETETQVRLESPVHERATPTETILHGEITSGAPSSPAESRTSSEVTLHSPTKATSFMTQPIREPPEAEGHGAPQHHVGMVTTEEEETLPIIRRVDVGDVAVHVTTTETVVREETHITKHPSDSETPNMSPTAEYAQETETHVQDDLPVIRRESPDTSKEQTTPRAKSPEAVPEMTETYVHDVDSGSSGEPALPYVHRVEETVTESHEANATVIRTHRVETTTWSESSTSATTMDTQSPLDETRATSFKTQPLREPPEPEGHAESQRETASPVSGA